MRDAGRDGFNLMDSQLEITDSSVGSPGPTEPLFVDRRSLRSNGRSVSTPTHLGRSGRPAVGRCSSVSRPATARVFVAPEKMNSTLIWFLAPFIPLEG